MDLSKELGLSGTKTGKVVDMGSLNTNTKMILKRPIKEETREKLIIEESMSTMKEVGLRRAGNQGNMEEGRETPGPSLHGSREQLRKLKTCTLK
jgi:hypothetical protein